MQVDGEDYTISVYKGNDFKTLVRIGSVKLPAEKMPASGTKIKFIKRNNYVEAILDTDDEYKLTWVLQSQSMEDASRIIEQRKKLLEFILDDKCVSQPITLNQQLLTNNAMVAAMKTLNEARAAATPPISLPG